MHFNEHNLKLDTSKFFLILCFALKNGTVTFFMFFNGISNLIIVRSDNFCVYFIEIYYCKLFIYICFYLILAKYKSYILPLDLLLFGESERKTN